MTSSSARSSSTVGWVDWVLSVVSSGDSAMKGAPSMTGDDMTGKGGGVYSIKASFRNPELPTIGYTAA